MFFPLSSGISASDRRAPTLDHVVVAVRDLEAAKDLFRKIGFVVVDGGTHPGFGTSNALIELDGNYIELLTVDDYPLATSAGIRRAELARYLRLHEGGLIGYAIQCGRLDEVLRRGRTAGPPLGSPLVMSRRLPDGRTVSWRLLIPGGSTWGRPWPFIIEWDAPKPATTPSTVVPHPNGARRLACLTVATTDLGALATFYSEVVDAVVSAADVDAGAGLRRTIELGDCTVAVVQARPVGRCDSRALEGPVEMTIAVRDLPTTTLFLGERGFRAVTTRRGTALARSEVLGVGITFTDAECDRQGEFGVASAAKPG